jgi:uroporphyrinogen-III decarboxylase
MTDKQFEIVKDVIAGKLIEPLPAGFIIDSPWLPGWAGISTLDYFTDDSKWFDANLKAVQTFPDIIFMPGFWSEYAMCTEPSAFGTKCIWHNYDMPYAEKIISDISVVDSMKVPNPSTDGLCPFVINRLINKYPLITEYGHNIYFAVARGPLNIASFLMGTTEFLIALRTDREKVHKLLEVITEFLVRWLRLQKSNFDSIDGIMILDDIVGFCGELDFEEFAMPYLKILFESLDVSVRFLHNDAEGKVCAPYLPEIGVNLFNFSFLHSFEQMKNLTSNKVALLGNIPPRDVLANGSAEDVVNSLNNALSNLEDKRNIIVSCGGGMPDGVPSKNITAFFNYLKE